jgi:carbonic anhydrase
MDVIYRYDTHKPIAPRQFANPDEAIRALEEGHRRHLHVVTQVRHELVGDHSSKQIVIPADPLSLGFTAVSGLAPVHAPFALFLGCSDARAPVEHIFDQSSNGLFVIRVAGNVLGVECLGSIDFAVQSFTKSLQLLVVMGHSTCGAVSAAVDSYLTPKHYAEISFTHSLRSLVDRIHIAVRNAAKALQASGSPSIVEHPDYRAMLVEAAVYLNAAITAYDVEREVATTCSSTSLRVVFCVFDLVDQHVRAKPGGPHDGHSHPPMFGNVPRGPDEFVDFSAAIAQDILARHNLL